MSILYIDIIYRYYLKLILNNIQKTKPYYNQQSTINNQQSTLDTRHRQHHELSRHVFSNL